MTCFSHTNFSKSNEQTKSVTNKILVTKYNDLTLPLWLRLPRKRTPRQKCATKGICISSLKALIHEQDNSVIKLDTSYLNTDQIFKHKVSLNSISINPERCECLHCFVVHSGMVVFVHLYASVCGYQGGDIYCGLVCVSGYAV